MRRIVVTGLGAVTPVGHNVEDTWRNILAGASGVSEIDSFDVSDFSVRIGASVRDFDLSPYLSPKDARKTDPFIHYGIAAAKQAIADAGLEVTEENAERIGIAIGSGMGGLPGIEKGHSQYLKGGPKRISPFFVPSNIINMIAGNLSIEFGIKGPNYGIVTACSTGTHNIGDAARLIQCGDVDVMIAGGAEAATSPTTVAAFASMKALSSRNDAPEEASRPWDKDRDGFVLGDGAGVLVLEEYEHAKARGAKIYAEVVGGGLSSDAYHMTAPHPEGIGVVRVMENCLKDAGLKPEDVDTINTHGTSTPLGDVAELKAISQVFGAHAPNININSTKSMTGHLLGAAGAIEAIASILAMKHGIVPPTINHTTVDENIDPKLNLTLNKAQKRDVNVAISNTFGFGGHNACVVFKKIS